jgi:hypothetical protein
VEKTQEPIKMVGKEGRAKTQRKTNKWRKARV